MKKVIEFCDAIEKTAERNFKEGNDFLCGYKEALKAVKDYCRLMIAIRGGEKNEDSNNL